MIRLATVAAPAHCNSRPWRLRVCLTLAIGVVQACSGDPAPLTGNLKPSKVDSSAIISIAGLEPSYAAGEAVAISAKAVRKDSEPIANLPITFGSSTSGTVIPAIAITDASGVARTTWTMPLTTGLATLLASGRATRLTVTTQVKAATAVRITKLAGDAQLAFEGELLPTLVRVSVTDAFGNGVVGRAVTFVVTSGGGSVTAVNATTADDGSASSGWRVGAGGLANTLEVRALDLPTATFTATSRMPLAGNFAFTGSMLIARVYHTATLLRDGRVLITGGYEGLAPIAGFVATATAELYDPTTARFTPTANTMMVARAGHSATLLTDGRVLIAGGNQGGVNRRGVDLFDPATNTFVPTGSVLDPQVFHEGTLLSSGEVLITGAAPARAELYDPVSGEFRYTGPYADTITAGISATLLNSGRVLLASVPRAELYDPATGTFVTTGAMLTTASFSYIQRREATLLINGSVLLTGGEQEDVGSFDEAELYDPATGTFRYTMSMPYRRSGHTATRLPSGRVLIAGGAGLGNFSAVSAEVYDVNGLTWAAAGPLKSPRDGHQATLLQDGRVMLTGGYAFHNGSYTVLNSAELFTERR